MLLLFHIVQITSEWRDIDFADADISLLGVNKITDVRDAFRCIRQISNRFGSYFMLSRRCFDTSGG